MAECITCGGYTKFNGGLCYKCYKKENNSEDVAVAEKPKAKPKTKTSTTKFDNTKDSAAQKTIDVTTNNFNYNLTKGRIAETLIERLFVDLGFQVFQYGMENTIPGIKDLLRGVKDDVAMNIRRMPDLVVFKDNQAHFIEVKFRANGCFKLSDIDKNGDYPYQNALIVLMSKKHIKCISFEELQEGKEITETSRNYLGNRKEFDTDKDKIIEYCNYAVKFFQHV
ncbi:hypothetical protein [uncultured Winogradskyella sp.]|uniref:hypothetical protein n=1 Tax=uncultured Winogradskyella sp. TaxID=395353 RepID=UPI00261C06AC|nr:hypothetical protein [uncultured Winogradskyella sp.]